MRVLRRPIETAAPNRPLRSGFPISNIERLLTRAKQTAADYFLCVDERRKTANSGHFIAQKRPGGGYFARPKD